MMEYKDKALIVSGGSRGLGLAIVGHYLERGCKVATFARRETAEMAPLRQRHGSRFLFEPLDVEQTEKVEGFVTRAAETFGSIHGLVNNAAIGQDHLLANMPVELIGHIIATNLQAPILLTREAVRKMLLNRSGGRIVNVTSVCGSRGYAGLTVYSATKGGMDAFTRSLARVADVISASFGTARNHQTPHADRAAMQRARHDAYA